MKATSRVIVPFCPTLENTLVGCSADVYSEDIEELAKQRTIGHLSVVEKNGQSEGTLIYICGKTPYDLFPHRFKKR